MVDPLHALRAKRDSLRQKVERLAKQHETANTELADVETAIRVLASVTGVGDENADTSLAATPGDRQASILASLGEGRGNAQLPKTIYETYFLLEGESINLDTFRTTIWRMAKRQWTYNGTTWAVKSQDGAYWKEIAEGPPDLSEGPNAGGVAERSIASDSKSDGASAVQASAPVGSNPTASAPIRQPWERDNAPAAPTDTRPPWKR